MIEEGYLSSFRLLEQNTTVWVIYKQQTLISHTSGGGKKSKIKAQADSVFGEGLFLTDDTFYVSSHGGNGQRG
jgi:hypothetical protein